MPPPQLGEARLAEDAPGDGLFAWLRAFVAHVATKRELALALADTGGRSELFDRWHEAMRVTASALLARAQEAGEVRPEVSAADLLALANGIAVIGTGDESVDRLLELVRTGVNTTIQAMAKSVPEAAGVRWAGCVSDAFPLVPALAVIFAGVLHATWNAVAKAAPDRYAGFALIGISQAGAGLLMVGLSGTPARTSWPWILASIALHVVYMALLARSYELGDFNQVYPLARGTGPLIVAFVAATTLGERLSVPQLAGIAAVCGGLGTLAFAGGVSRGQAGAIGAAVLTGVSIAGYTLVDGVGVRHAGTATGYSGWLFFGMGPVVVLWVYCVRGSVLWTGITAQWRLGIPGGLISVLGYAIVVWAQTRGALAAVAALRETGVISGAIIGAVFFHERMGLPRFAAAGVVVIGVALINVR